MIGNYEYPKNIRVFADAADTSRIVQAPAAYADIEAAFSRAMSRILANEATAKDAMDTCAKEIDAIFAYNY
jgi:ABC-type glycerol-3-phosphate transport system substrate-binding protein